MAEGVGVETDLDFRGQRAPAVVFAIERVANKTFGCGDIAVRLHRPAANYLPTALADALLDFIQHLRVSAFHPAVVSRRRMAVTESRGLVDAVQCAAKCGQHGIGA